MRHLAPILLILAAVGRAETPIVSSVHTVSIHVKDYDTYNALFRLFEKDLQLPVIYGSPWTSEKKRRTQYAGIWAGNVVLEPCGPYAGESFAADSSARLHGLTFRPHETAISSATQLDARGIGHKAPATWSPASTPGDVLHFVSFTDEALVAPALSVSIMEVTNRGRERTEQEAARSSLSARRGGPLGVLSVLEVQIGCPDAQTRRKWQELLARGFRERNGLWTAGEGPGLRFLKSETKQIVALLMKVQSLEKARSFLQQTNILGKVSRRLIEIDPKALRGAGILLTE